MSLSNESSVGIGDGSRADEAVLLLERLNVTFDTPEGEVTAVEDLSLTLARGECLGVVGESGAGKSQAFLAMMGLLASNGRVRGSARFGEIELIGRRSADLDQVRGVRIGMVFQDPMTSLTPHICVGDQVAEPLVRHLNVPWQEARSRALALLQRVHVTDAPRRMTQYPHELSGGMRQRVMIAIALACDPELLIADEPTTALDVTIQAQILALLAELKRERGMAMVLITHDLGAVAGIADRVAVMRGGHVVELGSVSAIMKTPRHPYTQALLRAMPRMQGAFAGEGTGVAVPAAKAESIDAVTGKSTDAVAVKSIDPLADNAYSATQGQSGDERLKAWGAHPDAVSASVSDRAVSARLDGAPAARIVIDTGATSGGTADSSSRLADSERDGGVQGAASSPSGSGTGLSSAALTISRLSVQFPVSRGWFERPAMLRAVDEVSLELRTGEALGVVGESGCGKSTLARAALLLMRPTAGKVVWMGRALETLSARELKPLRRDLQIVFQDPLASLDPRMTIGEIVDEPLHVHHPELNASDRKRAVADMLVRVGIAPELVNRYPHEFSGGQCQRIGIARAMILKPRLLVCDEPVSALDVSIQEQIVTLLADLKREYGMCILFVSHNLAVVQRLCERVLVLYLGRMMELATSKSLYANPLHPYTRDLLKAVPIPDPDIQPARLTQILIGEPPSPLAPPTGCVYRTRCPHALDPCRQQIPPWEPATPSHSISCHRWKDLNSHLFT